MDKRGICITVLIFLAIFLNTLSLSFSSNFVMSVSPPSNISGYVYDFYNGKPLSNVIVLIYYEYHSWSELVGRTVTNDSGFYSIDISKVSPLIVELGLFKIYLFHLDASSNTPDYVPIYLSTNLGKLSNFNFNFHMIPAAIIKFSGSFMHVNYSEPAKRVFYQVNVESDIPKNLNCLLTYDFKELSKIFSEIGILENLVAIPAGFKCNVLVTGVFEEAVSVPSVIVIGRTSTTVSSVRESYLNILLFDDFRILAPGESLYFSVYDVSLMNSFKLVNSLYNNVLYKLDKARMDGFYVTKLYSQLNRIKGIIDDSLSLYSQNYFAAVFANLRECCILIKNLSASIDGLYNDAKISINFLLIFFAIGSIAIGYALTERLILKFSLSIVSYIFLLYLTSISYPLSPKFDFNILPLILSPVIIGFIIEFMGSGIHGIKTISDSVDLFSVSKRNLRRRKLRTILLLISFIIFTAGSLVLTSFSLEIDLLMASRSNVYGVNGLGLEFRVPEAYSVSGFSDVEAENNPYAMNLLPTIINMPSILGDVENVTFRAESKARVRPYMRLREDISIMGIVSFSDPSDPVAKLVSSTFIEGHPPTNGGEVAVSFSLASKLGLKIGDSLSIMTRRYIICGLFDDNAIYGLRELSGRPVLPYKMILSMKGEDGVPSIYESRVCDPSEVIFIHWSEIDYYKLSKTRAFFTFNHTADIYSIGKTIALRGGNILATVLTSDDCVNMLLAEYLASSGFEAFIPMFLIILNAAISAAASLHERRREVLVMTSLGANPTQTFKIFLNESLVLGFSAGSLGYVLGIVLYKFMSNVSSIEVAPKISFMWVFFSLTLALLSSILGSSIILRSSLVVVPSKLWNIRYTTKSTAEGEVRVFEIPVKLSSSSIEPFLRFISNRLRNYPSTSEEFIKVIGSHVDKIDGKLVYKLIFTYDVGLGSTSKNNSRNVLEVYVENGECRVSLYVKCVGSNPEKHSLNVARLVRHIVMEWGG